MSKTTDNGLKRSEKARSNRLNLSDFWCLTPFFSNISAKSWQQFLHVEEAGVP
jgi:hypothetical protein